MSGGAACVDKSHRAVWQVTHRMQNRSAFNGNRVTPSAWSEVRCPLCRRLWRTRASYVRTLPDAPAEWWRS